MPADQGGMISAQYTGDNCLELTRKLCQERHVGYRMPYRPTFSHGATQLFFIGARDISTIKNPYKFLSPDYDNLRKTGHSMSAEKEKTIAYVVGEVRANTEKVVMDRKELPHLPG